MKTDRPFIKFLTVITAVSLLASCAMFSSRETPGEYANDAAITTKIKANILGDAKLKVFEVNVETMQGVVQLSGFVDSEQSDARAVAIAHHVQGVKGVKDDLIIRDAVQ